MKTSSILLALASLTLASAAHAQVYITEFFYQGQAGTTGNEHEFVELTNVGAAPVDVAGWYYRDSTGNPATPFSLTGFGSIAAGESVIVTDISETDFRTVWSTLDAGVRVLGGAVPGLGRGDSIRIFDAGNGLVDQIDYGDENFSGTPRWRFTTGVTEFSNLGQNDIYGWYQSSNSAGWFNGLPVNNLTSINGDIGNPGYVNFVPAAVPEPSTYGIIAGSLMLVGAVLRRRLKASRN